MFVPGRCWLLVGRAGGSVVNFAETQKRSQSEFQQVMLSSVVAEQQRV